MKDFIKRITGLKAESDQLEKDKEELLSKRDPKAYATRKS